MVKGSTSPIMVALECRPESEKAAEFDIHTADLENANPIFAHVMEDTRMRGVIGAHARYGDIKLVERYNRARMESAIDYMRLLEEQIDKSKIKAKSDILHDIGKSVAEMIVEHARKNNAETFVVGTRGLPKFRRSLGSVAGGFSNHAHNPVLTTR